MTAGTIVQTTTFPLRPRIHLRRWRHCQHAPLSWAAARLSMSAPTYRQLEQRYDFPGHLIACMLFTLGPGVQALQPQPATFLRAFRDVSGLSQARAAALLDTTHATWGRREQGAKPLPLWLTLAVAALYRYPTTRERRFCVPDMTRWTLAAWPPERVAFDMAHRTALRWDPYKNGNGDWQWYIQDLNDRWVLGQNADGSDWDS